MKRLLMIIAVCQLTFIAALPQSLSDRYNGQRPVVMVCDWDKPPYEYLNDKGEPAGSNIDAMRAVMKELGIPIRFVMKEWSIAIKTFERGNADIIIANARRYRKDKYAISENIINYNRVRVATNADSTGMITLRQLESEGARRLLCLLFYGRRLHQYQFHGVPNSEGGSVGCSQWRL